MDKIIAVLLPACLLVCLVILFASAYSDYADGGFEDRGFILKEFDKHTCYVYEADKSAAMHCVRNKSEGGVR